MKTKSELSELWNHTLRGDTKAFAILYKELYPLVYKSVLKSVKDEDSACDLVQDLFVRLWIKRYKIGRIACITQYFLVSARSIVINHLRKKSVSSISFCENLTTLSDPSPEIILIEKETDLLHCKNFRTALLNLPERQRQVLYMRFHKGYSHNEIEARTGISYQSIANHLYRATVKLRLEIGDIGRPGQYFMLG
ncbi:RNA polymerase sigma factor [Mucilaginibacter sp. UR6-1]|uniref:RNA polymerase sigma factor n=1 Tax=Mucilaginibacter sp. UR6-1 TaxID=1435643 RepID=UPI001E3856C3|nr:sigma-70 family RNA polymerase sigma factor [Mucilaginibacter sp. UR6-1]